MGSEEQMNEILEYAVDSVIKPRVEVLAFSIVNEAIERLRKNDIAGRIVVTLP